MTATETRRAVPSVLAPGLLLGLGLGGFVDGILLHQVLQWHHMLSNTQDDRIGIENYPVDTVAGLEVNTLWDGFFHVATWIAVVVGLVLLWRRITRSSGPWLGQSLLGAALAGWGVFNLVEGIVDHHLLQLHHVRLGLILYQRGQRRLSTAPTQDPHQHHLQSTQSQRGP